MAWRKAAVRMKRRMADWPWQPKERGEQRADWQGDDGAVTEGRAQGKPRSHSTALPGTDPCTECPGDVSSRGPDPRDSWIALFRTDWDG